MKDRQLDMARAEQEQWLKLYYFLRAAVSVAWVVAAFAVGQSSAVIAGLLLVAYPAWDAAANFLDASRSGVVLSAIQGRDYARIYIKELEGGRAAVSLSPEEQEAVERAMKSQQ